MNSLSKKILLLLIFSCGLISCSDKKDPVIEIPVSDGSKLTLNGGEGGASAVNSVFVDFSEDKQTPVLRASWDLGFYCGSDDFRVILNHSTGGSAIALDKTDLNEVTALDTIQLEEDGILNVGHGSGSYTYLDPVEGGRSAYLSGTVIKAISATDTENKVYIYARGNSGTSDRGWQKIKIIRKGSGYTLQYAGINETSFKSLDISKDTKYNFKYVSFDKGAVEVEPERTEWDIEWGLTTYKASPTIPYTFSDFVIINFVGGVQAAEVMTSMVSYADFKESDLAALTFSGTREVIGGNWRVTSGGTVGVKTDRFYVIKDAAGNVYKLKFISFHANDGGERGKPEIEYSLVKKG
jgi:hypothetical protein